MSHDEMTWAVENLRATVDQHIREVKSLAQSVTHHNDRLSAEALSQWKLYTPQYIESKTQEIGDSLIRAADDLARVMAALGLMAWS